MRASEFARKAQRNSKIYLDMDGVLADFFAEYAKMANVKSYRDIPPAKADPLLDSMIGTDFFARLPKFPTTDQLVKLAVSYAGNYHICSSPLRGDFVNSAYWKKIWLRAKLTPQPTTVEITSNKPQHAVSNGVPNILIDDKGSNIRGWREAGGIGIKYQADEDSLEVVKQALELIFCDVKDTCDTDEVQEDWSEKYKKSIDCNNPKGFSQKAHCAGKKKKANENFADGENPGRKGLAKRMGVDCSKSETELRKIAKNSTGEKQRMAHWCANMKGGKK